MPSPDFFTAPAGPIAQRPPPTGFVHLHSWQLISLGQVHELRAGLYGQFGAGAAPDRGLGDPIERLVLIASELATNALHHGGTPVTIGLSRHAERVLLDVTDTNVTAGPVLEPSPRPHNAGGHGLQLTHLLAGDLGWHTTTHGKHVWATVDLAP